MIDADDTAISNGRSALRRRRPEPGKHAVTFATTPKMSTYLVALLVGDFVCREGVAATTIRVCSPRQDEPYGVAPRPPSNAGGSLQRLFGIPIPTASSTHRRADFAAGAMETPARSPSASRLLLADEATASVDTLSSAAGW